MAGVAAGRSRFVRPGAGWSNVRLCGSPAMTGGGRKAAAELSDRHADLADELAAALARAQKRHVDDGLLSIEAAESYLEAGRLSQALSDECSRGELITARRRAGLTADRARYLMETVEIAERRQSALDLYAAYNITIPFRTEAEARAWRDDMATNSAEELNKIGIESKAKWGGLAGMPPLSARLEAYAGAVIIESRADWQARTRGEITEAQTTSPDIAQAATWFGTFYTGNDDLLDNKAWPALAGAGARAQGEADPHEPRVRRAVLAARRRAFAASGARKRKRKRKEKPPPTVREHIADSYSNLTRAHVALTRGATKYSRMDHIIRAKRRRGLIDGRIQMRSLYHDERLKMVNPQACHYCGARKKLCMDHMIPKLRDGPDAADNLVWACRSCNSSKGAKDMLAWMRWKGHFPPLLVLRRYLKIVARYCDENGCLDTPLDRVGDDSDMPFDVRLLPTKYPPLETLRLWADPDNEDAAS